MSTLNTQGSYGQAERRRGWQRLHERWMPWAIWAGLIPMALLTAGAAVMQLWLDYRTNPPSCYGIGWGCQLSPWAGGVFWLIIFCAPVIVLSAMVLGLAELAGPRFAFARSLMMIAVHVVGLAFAMLIIAEGS
ncbi:MAG TPA: hypothetical protein VF230_04265 [Acidimicrobiales bacterium]